MSGGRRAGPGQELGFDPFDLLGVDASADALTIDRAYKARIRYVHPDIAGPAGLAESKRLNIAREWLLDPTRRASLPGPRPARRRERPEPPPPRRQEPTWETPFEPRAPWDYDPWLDDALTFDYGDATGPIRAFFESIRSLTSDERARVTHSLGDEPPVHFSDYRDQVGDRLWGCSRALGDAVERVWRERDDEGSPLLFPRGRIYGNGAVVADAYAQWLLLGDAIRQGSPDGRGIDVLASRCTWPWTASVGQPRYGPYGPAVLAFMDEARALTPVSAERLARAWQRDMGSFLYGTPGEDWFPGALDTPKPELVSGRIAAVDASRIEPPSELGWEHHNGFRFALRLTAHVLAIGGVSQAGRDWLRPWREAFVSEPSFRDRARWGLPRG